MPGAQASSLRVGAVREALRESLFAACAIGLAAGVGLGAALNALDLPGIVTANPAELHSLVTTLLSAVVTVVGVVLSILVVAQQLASQQFSPRAIRTTMRDLHTRLAIGALFSYIGYMIAVIAGIDPGSGDGLEVDAGIGGAVVAVGLVAYLIQHVTQGFRSDELVRRIGSDTLAAVHRIAARDDESAQVRSRTLGLSDVPAGAAIVHARDAGYLQDVDVDHLARDLHAHGVRVRFEVGLGDFVPTDTGLGWAWQVDGGPGLAEDLHREVEATVAEHIRLGAVRTTQREVSSGVQQLVDIALRALSPAVNDPYTAVQSINTMTIVLQKVAARRQDWLVGVVRGTLVLTVPRPLVWDMVDHSIASVRRVAGKFPDVLLALVTLLRGVAAVRPDEGNRVGAHLDAIQAEAEQAGLLDVDVETVRTVVGIAHAEVEGRTPDQPPVADEEPPDAGINAVAEDAR